eukprot:gnl/MRDRNA2_/MRDRNA2_196890_c0_seq1.p1 gnl/MRDRNA2_/MRDRNA2_196890_c0~~gnl/MRDRNA2_/MRDRNA2_196890_c0_seq1.p1  ORF type:complete len:469 (-),score=102.03 gnl/MRDRNA2_/MRDRNA2_196890_c0_seq1:752-2038(-)
MTTLVSFSLGDRWQEVAMPIVHVWPWALFFFLLYVLIATVLLVGVIFASLVESQKTVKAKMTWIRECEHVEERKYALDRLENLFSSLDSDGSGALSWQEFFHSRQKNPEFDRLLRTLDLSEDDLHQLWRLLDWDGNGEINMSEFKETMWRLMSGETKWTLMINSWTTSQMNVRMEQHHKTAMEQLALQANRLGRIEENLMENDSRPSPRTPELKKSTILRKSRKSQNTRKTQKSRDTTMVVINDNAESRSFETEKPQAEVFENTSTEDDEEESIENLKNETFILTGEGLVDKYMRAVNAMKVARDHPDIVEFWGSGSFVGEAIGDRLYTMSDPALQCDFFVSHSWLPPDDYEQHFKVNKQVDLYSYKKIMELNNVLHQTQVDILNVSDHVQKSKFKRQFTALTQTGHKKQSIYDLSLWVDKGRETGEY